MPSTTSPYSPYSPDSPDSPAESTATTGGAENLATRRMTIVVNPNKIDDLEATKRLVAGVCERHGWSEPTWVETTAEETGEKQAREAVQAGAQVVASLGGDGTVRAVASALVGTDAALGLLPGGTGNLLARNLGLPVDALDEAVEALVTGSERRIDVGLVRTGHSRLEVGTGDRPADDEEVFLVMAGLGLDGEIMAGTNEKVKGVLGWPAYVISAGKQLASRGFSSQVEAAGSDGSVGRHSRTVIIGNCGTLQGGIELMPDARLDDGILDLIVIAPHGFLGWVSVLGAIATRNRKGHQRMNRLRSTAFTVLAKRPVEAEIDGDPIGERAALAVRVLPDALVVRVG